MKIGKSTPTRYEQLQVANYKRREAIQKAMEASAATRGAMVARINNSADAQVKLTEQILRSRVSKKA